MAELVVDAATGEQVLRLSERDCAGPLGPGRGHYVRTPETLGRMSRSLRARWNSLTVEERRSFKRQCGESISRARRSRSVEEDHEHNRRNSEGQRRFWDGLTLEQLREHARSSNRGLGGGGWIKSLSEEEKKAFFERSFNSLETREKIRQTCSSLEHKRLMCLFYSDPKWHKRHVEACRRVWWGLTQEERDRRTGERLLACHVRPTGPELCVLSYLGKEYPGQWLYNGDGKSGFVIGGRVPDFVNVNGGKSVIEVYGDYWHAGEDPSKKIQHYGEYGYDCLVLWEYECYDSQVLNERVSEFMRQKEMMPL